MGGLIERAVSQHQDRCGYPQVGRYRSAHPGGAPIQRPHHQCYIRGYHAELDGKSLGFEVTGFVFVGLSSQKDADLKHFEESARRWPQVRECHMLSGEVDFLLKCVARDLSAFQNFITDTVTMEKNVASVKSSLVIHASKQEPGYPIDVPA